MSPKPTTNISPFLMFSGTAREAVEFYVSVFDDSEVVHLALYEPGEAGKEGMAHQGLFTLCGQKFLCTDSVVEQPFTFTPTISFMVTNL